MAEGQKIEQSGPLVSKLILFFRIDGKKEATTQRHLLNYISVKCVYNFTHFALFIS